MEKRKYFDTSATYKQTNFCSKSYEFLRFYIFWSKYLGPKKVSYIIRIIEEKYIIWSHDIKKKDLIQDFFVYVQTVGQKYLR